MVGKEGDSLGGRGAYVGGGGTSSSKGFLCRNKNFLQQEWNFFICATPIVGVEFTLGKEALWREFLPDLFHRVEAYMPGWDVTQIPLKQDIIVFPRMTLSDSENFI